ncbi:MAG: M23 family metallopeptidase [Firmicutes bacterium]|nr:M23 family metallopeptidase [Bacillota bacterium]
MSNINDYLRGRRGQEKPRRRWSSRLIGQASLSLILFIIIAGSVNAAGFFGDSARYVLGEGVSAENSWFNREASGKPEAAAPVTAQDAALPDVSPADDGEQPEFTAPASGVVVTDIAVAAGGFTTGKGILIRGNASQPVKAAADGSVLYLGNSDDGYLLQLSHSGGFVSVYQGLSQVGVSVGEEVLAGQELGVTDSGNVTFSLLLNDTEVDPLSYLFD